jgi:hypothetical protein
MEIRLQRTSLLNDFTAFLKHIFQSSFRIHCFSSNHFICSKLNEFRFRIATLILIFSITQTPVFAQQKENENKKHFEIIGLLKSNEVLIVEEAIDNYGLLDAYRFDSQRRTVLLDGLNASVVLYSNQELEKPIGNQKRAALKSAPQGKTIRFAITPKGKLKVIAE